MAAKLARAMGVEGVLESDRKPLKALKFTLSRTPEKHDLNSFVALLKRDATVCVVGALEPLAPVNNQAVAFGRKSVAASLIGNLADTQEVLDLCAEHGMGPDIQVIPIQEIDEAYERVEKGDVRFRYVIDLASLERDEAA